jgi:hypothetical protein
MRKCRFQEKIDPYLLGRLPQDEAQEFEEHYFNCESCFNEMAFRDEVLSVVRQGGITPVHEPERERAGLFDRVIGAFTPVRWATVGVTAAAVLLAVWILLPRPGTQQPQFTLSSDQIIRGVTISLISPTVDVARAPEYLEWKPIAGNLEYSVSLSNGEPLWTATTKQTRVAIPPDVRARMKPGRTYSWQVKAFNADGTLVSLSSPVSFHIIP